MIKNVFNIKDFNMAYNVGDLTALTYLEPLVNQVHDGEVRMLYDIMLSLNYVNDCWERGSVKDLYFDNDHYIHNKFLLFNKLGIYFNYKKDKWYKKTIKKEGKK